MQALWIGLGLLLVVIILIVNPSFFETKAPLFYLLMLLLCLVTIFIAPDIKGSRSWLVLGPIRLQPAEFTKVSTALMVAWLFNQYGFQLSSKRAYSLLLLLILLPLLLIIAQSETGSALVFLSFFLALYREGFSGIFLGLGFILTTYFISALIFSEQVWWQNTNADLFVVSNLILLYSIVCHYIYGKRIRRHLIYILPIIIALEIVSILVSCYVFPFDISWISLILVVILSLYFIYLSLFYNKSNYILIGILSLASLGFFFSTNYGFNKLLRPHQQVRIRLALGLEEDLRGKGYNVEQSKIAIGSGGVFGKGFLAGTQTKLNYVPEQDTDFIFCTIGEEQGFIGSSILILIYSFFILRLVFLAERQTTIFGRVYGYCISAIFLFHFIINIGMVLGLIPVIGIPLPFFSYGGSSLWSFSIMLFIFLGIDARRYNKHL